MTRRSPRRFNILTSPSKVKHLMCTNRRSKYVGFPLNPVTAVYVIPMEALPTPPPPQYEEEAKTTTVEGGHNAADTTSDTTMASTSATTSKQQQQTTTTTKTKNYRRLSLDMVLKVTAEAAQGRETLLESVGGASTGSRF